MIRVVVGKTFIKDLKSLKGSTHFLKIKHLTLVELPNSASIIAVKNLKKLKGHKNYYRIKIGDYRIGLSIENNEIFLQRVLHRKEIYKYFPNK